jgi:hypothetical protein
MTFSLIWESDFTADVPLGSWGASSGTLSSPEGSVAGFWAYPYPWPDEASKSGSGPGGYYDPGQTVCISGGVMKIRLWRDEIPSWSPVPSPARIHSCALVPLASNGMKYGRVIETFKVTRAVPGYRSVHQLVPSSGLETVVFPGGDWTQNISATYRNADGRTEEQTTTDSAFTGWTTTMLAWTPAGTVYYVDGIEVFQVDGGPYVASSFVMGHESSLDSDMIPGAAEGSWAQTDIANVQVYSYTP